MHTLSYLWFHYFWPSDMGNGPEALQQTVVYGAIAVIFVPVVRKWFRRHVAELHAKMDHIIKHHPDIPDLPVAPPGK
jgi:hypothetical protein